MPYIKQERRKELHRAVSVLEHELMKQDVNVGDLNYIITRAVQTWIGSDANYERQNAAIGVVECVRLELYRRVTAPYEDRKIKENGDVYEWTEHILGEAGNSRR